MAAILSKLGVSLAAAKPLPSSSSYAASAQARRERPRERRHITVPGGMSQLAGGLAVAEAEDVDRLDDLAELLGQGSTAL